MAAKSKRTPILQLLMLAILCGLLTYWLWYPLKAARIVAKRHDCANNLRQLGIAVNSYREAYGRFPAKLSDLYPKYVSDLNAFSCAGNPHKIRRPEDIDSLSGYVLIAVDTSDTNSLDWLEKPLLTDRQRNHLGKWNEVSGGNILLGDGSVTWLPDKHATKEIDPYWAFDSTNAFDFPN